VSNLPLPLVWPSPLKIPVTDYLASQNHNTDTTCTTITLEY
jgi:hypothetical protein